jgi:arylsulfatase A-like enzyme
VRIAWIAVVAACTAGCGSKEPAPAGEDDVRTPDEPPVADGAQAEAAPADASPPPDPPRPEHAVFSLVDNRHAAHRYVDGELIVDASTVAFARYTRFGLPEPRWQLGKEVAGVRAAIADRVATLEVPLDAGLAKATQRLIVRVHAKAKQRLAIRINGQRPTARAKTSRIDLAEGWQTIALPIERGRLRVGENQIALETSGAKGKLAVEWLRFASAEDLVDPRGAIAFEPDAGAMVGAMTLGKGAAAVWYLTVPEGAHLVGEVEAGCKVEVQAVASDDSFAGGVLGPDSPRVDLTAMSGRVVGLTLAARECDRTRVVAPQIRLHGAPPSPLPKASPARYVVLWIMDSLRADKVPVFTPGARAQTPNLDELAKSSVVYRQYYVQGNESQTSHSTLWTGLYPAVHNVRLAGKGGAWKLDPKLDVLADQLRQAGFFTTAVTGNGFVTADGGYARGFAEFRNMMREKGVINGILYGDKVLEAALGRLDARRTDPVYLYLGTVDTHGPWIARRPWIDIYSPPPYDGPFKEWGTAKELGITPKSMGCAIIPPDKDIARLRAIYDSAISYQDRLLGELVARLKAWGIWEQTMLVITADHGEELFEDRRCGHGGSLRDSLIRVPLLVRDPGRFPGGTIVHEGAEGVDVLPTVLASIGAPDLGQVQGRSLAPLAQGVGRGWATPSYASMYEYAHAMRIGRWKIRVGQAGLPIVSDMVADPEERVDLSALRPVERRMLTDNLGLFLALRAQWKKAAWGVTTNVTTQGAKELDRTELPP